MQRLRLLTLTSLAVLTSCKPPDAALRVNVTVRAMGASRVRADCLRLTVSNETQELKSLTIKRPADDDAVFAVLRGSDLPATVKVQASGYLGNCADDTTLKLNAQGEAVTGVFPESGVTELAVFLDPPNSSLDADRDGFVAASKGGLDCRDDDNTVFPGAGQVCANTGDTDCDGQGGCDDSECGSAAVCLDPPERVQVTTLVTTMLRYECRGPFRVELRNANGPRLAIRDTAVALTSSLPGMSVHGVASCNDTALTSLTIPYGESSFEVFLQADAQAFGINTFTATAAQVATPGRAMVEVHPQPFDHVEFTTPPRTVSAGQCSTEPVTLEFRDVMNRRTDADQPTTVTLSSAPGDLNNANIFFNDAACATDGSMQQVAPGQGTFSLQLKAGRAGSFTLTATPSAGTGQPRTQPLTVQPAAATQLAFTNNPLVINSTQSCSAGVFTLALQDQFQNPVTAGTGVPVRVTVSGLTNVELFDATTMCTSAAQTDFTIPAGSSSIPLRARGMMASATPGEIRAAVLNGAPITDATQPLRISAGFASKFILTGSAQSPMASVCSANPFSVELLDSANNPASSDAGVAFSLTTVPPSDTTFRFYAGAGCQTDLGGMVSVPAGQTSSQFYYRGNKVMPSFEIRAASVLTPPATFLPGNSIRPGLPGKLLYGTAPPFGVVQAQTAQAGICSPSPYLATVVDLFDNPTSFTAPQTVTINSTPGGVTAGDVACTTGNTLTLAPGSSQVSFIARHTTTSAAGTPYSLTATVNGFTTPTAATLTVTPGNSTLQVDVPSGAAAIAAGACQQITLTRRDGFNNNAPTSGPTALTLGFPASTNWLVYANANCANPAVAPTAIAMNSTHTVTFSVKPQTSGNYQLSASLPGPQTALIDFQVAPGAPTLVFEQPATGVGTASATQTAGGCTPVTVARKDSFSNDVPLGSAQNLTFTNLPLGTTIHTGTPCTAINLIGTSTIGLNPTDARASFYVSATKSLASGGPVVQAIIPSLASQSATLSLTVNPGSPVLGLVLPSGGAATVVANDCIPVTLERRDNQGNLVPVTITTAAVTITPAGLSLFSATNCTSPGAVTVPAGASSRAFSVRTNTALASTVYTVALDSQAVPLTLTVNPGPVAQLSVLGLPASMTAGGCVGPVTVRRRDNWTNDITNGAASVGLTSAQFTFFSANDCTGAVTSVNINDGQAISGPFYARAIVAGTATMTATLGVTGTGSLTVNPAAPVFSVIVPVGGTATVTANACVPVTVERRDTFGNLVPVTSAMNLTVTPTANLTTFSATDCTGAAITNVPVSSGASSRAFSVRTTVANPSLALTISLDGQTAPLTLTVNPGPTTKLLVEGLPATLAARGCTGALLVRRLDTWNNNVTAEATLTVTLSSAQLSFSSQATTCGSPTTGASVTIANGSSTSGEALYATATAAGTATATANATAPSGPVTGNASTTVLAGPASKLVLLNAAGTVLAGACSGSLQVELRDQDENPVTPAVGSPFSVTLGSTPNTPTFSTGTTCAGALPLQLTNAVRVGLFSFRPTTAPASEVVSASGAGVTAATQTWTINPGAATKLVWKQNPVTPAARFGCVSAGVLQTQDSSNNVTVAGVATTVTPTPSTPSTSGVTFFSDAACTTPISTLSIGAAASETAEFYMLATGANPTLAATSSPALTAAPNRPIVLTNTGSLAITPVDPALEAGACVAVTVERRDDLGAVFTRGTTTFDLSVPTTTPQNVTLHLVANCSDAAQALPLRRTIANGASTAVVYARGRSSAPAVLPTDSAFTAVDLGGITASASGLTTLKVYPLVRRGTCNIVAGQSSNTCALAPAIPGNDISRSFLVFSSTGTPLTTSPPGLAADEQSVECHLDASGAVTVVCSRASTGGNSTAPMNVNYQVVSWGRDFASGFGVSVQHFPSLAVSAVSTAVTLSPAVTVANSFVLASSKFSGQNDADAFPLARLTSTTNVEIVATTTAARTVSLQVVSFVGATVAHNSVTAQTGQPTVTVTSPTTTSVASTFVLGMAQATDGSATLMCKRRFKGKVSSTSDVTFRRGANASGTTCSADTVALLNAQRISIPAAAIRAPADVTITGSGTLGTSAAFTAVTPHKSIVLTGMQGPGGQCAGEGAYAGTGNDNDDTGPFHALLDLNGAGTQVTVTRTAPQASADSIFAPFVVQFDP